MLLTETELCSFTEKDSARLQEYFRSILTKINFIPAIRHIIGWRGIKQCTSPDEAWTFRMSKRPGVFGIMYKDTLKGNSGEAALFRLFYFPAPEEDLVEQISINGGIMTQREDYLQLIREFVFFPEFHDLFYTGDFLLGLSPDGGSSFASVCGLDRKISVSTGGVFTDDGRTVIEPGEDEENCPCGAINTDFFDLFASSMTWLFKNPPVHAGEFTLPGTIITKDQTGQSEEKISDRTDKKILTAFFGNTSRDSLSGIPEYFGISENQAGTFRLLSKGDETAYSSLQFWDCHTLSQGSSIDKKMLGIEDRIPFIVLSGFLGAGKTTFLNQFIEYQHSMNRMVAVIQNELGQKGVDTSLLESSYSVLEIDEGCVCCSLAGNLKGGICQIKDQFNPDYIILETTGAANPKNLLDEIIELEDDIIFDSITVIADADSIIQSLDKFHIATEQIESADIVILNKADLVTEEQIEKIKEMIKEINPHCIITPSSFCSVSNGMLYSFDQSSGRIPGSLTREHSGHVHYDDGLNSVTAEIHCTVNPDMILDALDFLPEKVFRIKGIVGLQGKEEPWSFQYVNGRYDLSPNRQGISRDRYLVFIGQGVSEEDITPFIEKLA